MESDELAMSVCQFEFYVSYVFPKILVSQVCSRIDEHLNKKAYAMRLMDCLSTTKDALYAGVQLVY